MGFSNKSNKFPRFLLNLFEMTHRKKDGSHIFCSSLSETSSVKLLERPGNPPLFISVERDISDRKQAGKEKEKLESQFRQSHKMEAIRTMAGGIAHGFNNIPAAILGYADIAKSDIPDFSPAYKSIEQIFSGPYTLERNNF